MSELLPCPFCGAQAERYKRPGAWYVRCSNVKCCVLAASDTYFFSEEWNRRAALPEDKSVEGRGDSCPECNGQGRRRVRFGGQDGGDSDYHSCHVCNGTGKAPAPPPSASTGKEGDAKMRETNGPIRKSDLTRPESPAVSRGAPSADVGASEVERLAEEAAHLIVPFILGLYQKDNVTFSGEGDVRHVIQSAIDKAVEGWKKRHGLAVAAYNAVCEQNLMQRKALEEIAKPALGGKVQQGIARRALNSGGGGE